MEEISLHNTEINEVWSLEWFKAATILITDFTNNNKIGKTFVNLIQAVVVCQKHHFPFTSQWKEKETTHSQDIPNKFLCPINSCWFFQLVLCLPEVSSGTLKQSEEASGEAAKQTPRKPPSEQHIKTKIIIPALWAGQGKAVEFWRDGGVCHKVLNVSSS